MENQGKRLLLAVGLALGVMLLWNMVFPPDKKEPEPPAVPPVTAGSGSAGSAAPTPDVVAAATEPACTDGELTTLSIPGEYTAKFSTCGGTLVSWKLANKKFERDATHGEMLSGKDGFGAFHVGFWGSSFGVPRNAKWTKQGESPTGVTYKLDTPALDIEKTFTIFPDYSVKMAVTYTLDVPAGSVARQRLAVTAYEYQDPAQSTEGSMQVAARVWVSSTMRGGEIAHSSFGAVKKASRHELDIRWTGFEHPYLFAAFSPRRADTEAIEKYTRAVEGQDGVVHSTIVFPELVFEQGKGRTDTREVVGYLGPKNYDNLEAADSHAAFSTGFSETVDLGWFAFIGRPLLWLLLKFYSVFGNWGIAIVLLTILVKAATLYWTTKSMRSMKKMAALAPQMKKLQEKYKDDKQRMQVETMALYKVHGVNPIAGCLPIFLQMPIWIALYRMLSSAGELYQEPFIPGWIDDLTSTDPYYILPIVLVITMFAQARLTPQTGDSRQQKFLQYGMPLMFGVMSFFFPAGLTLYIFTNTILSALHSIYMNKFDKKTLAAVAAMKKQIDDAEAKAAQTAASSAKHPKGIGSPGGSLAPGNKGTKMKVPAAKPVIDVEADESDADEDESSSDGATAVAPPARKGPAQQRGNKKGKKRR